MQDNQINEWQEYVVKELTTKGASLVGFGDITSSGTKITGEFPIAISIAVKCDEEIVENLHTDEFAFYMHLKELKGKVDTLVKVAEGLIRDGGYNYQTVTDASIKNSKHLKELRFFSHALAAAYSGLGWIGKNSLLITPNFGPRVRLATVLTDANFTTAMPSMQDKCGECDLCVIACPYQAIHNINWGKSVSSEMLVDGCLCYDKRCSFFPVLGRSYSCGRCMQACKIGRNRK
jgi:epoxyqueuosine reductase